MNPPWKIFLLFVLIGQLESAAQISENRGGDATIPIAPLKGKIFALVVGISDYESPMINDLKYAVADARSIAEYLNSAPFALGIPVIELYDKNATRTNIREKGITKIDNLIADHTITHDDIVLIYLAGHGGVFTKDDSFFFPHDAAHMTDAGTSFSIKTIKGYIRKWASKSKATVVFIFDACRSATVVNGQTEMDLDVVSRFLEEDTGEILMAATRGGQPAQETKELMHGVFSFYLLEGLYGKADITGEGQISINELESYVISNVTSKTKMMQSPMVKFPPSLDKKIIASVKPELLATVDQKLKLDLSTQEVVASVPKVGDINTKSIELTELIKNFTLALTQNRLIKPAENCAYDYYQKMIKLVPASTLQDQLIDLNIALYDAALNTVKQDLNGERAYLKPPPQFADSLNSIKDQLKNGYDLNYYKDASACMKAYIDLKSNNVEAGAFAMYEYLVGRDLTIRAEQNGFSDAIKVQAAITSLKKSAEKYNDQAFIWQGLAMAYWGNRSNDLAKAKEAANNALRLAPQWSYPLVSLATYAFFEKNNEQGNAYLQRATELNKLDFIGYYILGRRLAEDDKKEEAIIHYEKVIQLNPYFAPAYIELAADLIKLKRTDEAILQYKKIKQLQPSFTKAYVDFGWLLTKLTRYEEAIVELKQAVNLVPANAGNHFYLGWAFYKLNHKPEALTEFETAIQLDPSSTLYHDIMADCLHDLSRHNDAVSGYKKSIQIEPKENVYPIVGLARCLKDLGRTDEAIQQYQKAIQVKPDDVYAYSSLGNILSELGRNEEAIAQFQKGIQVDPNDASAYHSLGEVLSKLDRNEEAIAQFQKGIQVKPDYVYNYSSLGGVLSELGRNEDAVIQYQKAIQIKPNYVYAYTSLGKVLSNLGRNEEAIAQYQKAIQVKPDYVYAYTSLGRILSKLGRNEEAIVQYQKAIQLEPNDATNYTSLASIFSKLERNEEAITLYQKAIQLKPNEAFAYTSLAEIFKKLERNDEAIAQYQKAIQVEPKNADSHSLLGILQFQLGRSQEAIIEFNKAIEINPMSFIAHFGLGEVFRKLKRNEEAVTQYQKAIQIDPKYADTHFWLGFVLLTSLEKTEEAVVSFEQTLKFNPDNRNAYWLMGIGLVDLGNKEKAANQNSKATEYFQKAEKLYLQFITKIPTDPEAYYGYASVLALTNRPTDALGQLKIAFEKGYNNWKELDEDENLSSIRTLSEFDKLITSYKK